MLVLRCITATAATDGGRSENRARDGAFTIKSSTGAFSCTLRRQTVRKSRTKLYSQNLQIIGKRNLTTKSAATRQPPTPPQPYKTLAAKVTLKIEANLSRKAEKSRSEGYLRLR